MNHKLTDSDHASAVECFSALWGRGESPPDLFSFISERQFITPQERAQLLLCDQRERWRRGIQLPVESYLEKLPELGRDPRLVVELISAEQRLRSSSQSLVESDDDSLSESWDSAPEGALLNEAAPRPPMRPVAFSDDGETLVVTPPGGHPVPPRVGRFRLDQLLGHGGFGHVYLAFDEHLRRPVAVKLFHRPHSAADQEVQAYLAEARIAAALDHPAIVPVYDVGEDQGFCYLVSKYISGTNLAELTKRGPLPVEHAVELMITVAEALHYAHDRGMVHRDVKPGNVLIDSSGKPHVIDFGLALAQEKFATGSEFAGTPLYMSPEQARGEGHLVDGRSDVFSLGVMLFELATGHRPFSGTERREILQQVVSGSTPRLRDIDASVDVELERICLRAMSKRVIDRYESAHELAKDLRVYRAKLGAGALPHGEHPVIPKGLRSFDAGDAEFFLKLLPGPRDVEGVPDSVRFWKSRVEAAGGEGFRVGVIYGPSGCGKSSLVKAGLLPRLSRDVWPVYLEAAGDGLEERLLAKLKARCRRLGDAASLPGAVGELRRGDALSPGRKVLIVLDQFEQWLHGRAPDGQRQLIEALRQCDGERVCCLLLIRDDFWLGLSRFMGELEVEIVQGRNAALVDLFDGHHAQSVLQDFGRAYRRIGSPPTREQRAFLDQAVQMLSEEERVVPVRLAMFAEMLKARPWTPQTLREIGGPAGAGTAMLQDLFRGAVADPRCRRHEHAARCVLQALVPADGSGIRGEPATREALLAASAYRAGEAFDDVMRLLCDQLRLLTAVDPPEPAEEGETPSQLYQLTHDYLVPAARQWTHEVQNQTRRGRAALRLAERAAQWQRLPQSRSLPAWWEWLNILIFTRPRSWVQPQRALMKAASKFHGARTSAVALLVLMTAWCLSAAVERSRAHMLLERLVDADVSQVPAIVAEMADHPGLHVRLSSWSAGSNDPRRQLNLAMGLLSVDPSQAQYLQERLTTAAPNEVQVIAQMLARHSPQSLDELWSLLEAESLERGARVRLAAALAVTNPSADRWPEVAGSVAEALATENLSLVPAWLEQLWPVRHSLVAPLRLLVKSSRNLQHRHIAAVALARYLQDDPDRILELIDEAEPEQLPALVEGLRLSYSRSHPKLLHRVASQATDVAFDAGALHARANAVIAAYHLGDSAPLCESLSGKSDVSFQTLLIHRLASAGVDPVSLVQPLQSSESADLRYALLLAIGEYGQEGVTPDQATQLIGMTRRIHSSDPDAGVHSAAEWLLRTWGSSVPDPARSFDASADWFAAPGGYTFAVIEGPHTHGSAPPHRYAILTTEVTLKQFLQFQPSHAKLHTEHIGPESEHPVNSMTYLEALQFCRWLSEQHGFHEAEMCYPPLEDLDPKGPMPQAELSKPGYRLPTEAEFQYATRSGSSARYSFGEDITMLRFYAWTRDTSPETTQPVGRLKPNRFGIFDLHGNLDEWCHSDRQTYLSLFGEPGPPMPRLDQAVLRGASFAARKTDISSEDRGSGCSFRSSTRGFSYRSYHWRESMTGCCTSRE